MIRAAPSCDQKGGRVPGPDRLSGLGDGRVTRGQGGGNDLGLLPDLSFEGAAAVCCWQAGFTVCPPDEAT